MNKITRKDLIDGIRREYYLRLDQLGDLAVDRANFTPEAVGEEAIFIQALKTVLYELEAKNTEWEYEADVKVENGTL